MYFSSFRTHPVTSCRLRTYLVVVCMGPTYPLMEDLSFQREIRSSYATTSCIFSHPYARNPFCADGIAGIKFSVPSIALSYLIVSLYGLRTFLSSQQEQRGSTGQCLRSVRTECRRPPKENSSMVTISTRCQNWQPSLWRPLFL
jgi:hypothetical protein